MSAEMSARLPRWDQVSTIVFDFDGVFTDNRLSLDQNGVESVTCSREDGLGIDILKGFKKLNSWNLDCFILSTEKSSVVVKRAEKLGISCQNGESDKVGFLKRYLRNKKYVSKKMIYLGNDLNDLAAIESADFSIVPADAHNRVKKAADIVMTRNGGHGFVREFIERFLEIDSMKTSDIERILKVGSSIGRL